MRTDTFGLLDMYLVRRICMVHVECLPTIRQFSSIRNAINSLLFLGGLRGIPVCPKACISPCTAPKPLCDPATGIGTAPFLSECILEPLCIRCVEFGCCVEPPPAPVAAKWAKPFMSEVIACSTCACGGLWGFVVLDVAQVGIECAGVRLLKKLLVCDVRRRYSRS